MFDLQVNGLTTDNFHCDFWEAPEDELILKLCKHEFKLGIKNILATVITGPLEKIKNNIQRISDFKKQFNNDFETVNLDKQSYILGIHIEGGLISRLGIHPEKHAKEFNLKNAKELVHQFPGLIKLWTLCPSLDTDGDLTKFLQDQGIKVAYGHSNANYDEACMAFEKYNVDLVTHWGNAMKIIDGLDNRNTSDQELLTLDEIDVNKIQDRNSIGLAFAAYENPKIYTPAICGSIKDQDLHLAPNLVKKLANKKQDKFILVSDSVAKLPNQNGELRGGLKTLFEHSQNALEIGLSTTQVEAATSQNPYKALNIDINHVT